jgi:hypothetical protein
MSHQLHVDYSSLQLTILIFQKQLGVSDAGVSRRLLDFQYYVIAPMKSDVALSAHRCFWRRRISKLLVGLIFSEVAFALVPLYIILYR